MHAIPNLLTSEELSQAMNMLSSLTFVDGKASAGKYAQGVKENQQAKRDNDHPAQLDTLIGKALGRSDLFRSIALPKRFLPPIYSKYEPGMHYGSHVDNAMIGGKQPLRADLSVTVFLSDIANYDGGELGISTAVGEQLIKLPAGHAVVYDSTTLHRVTPITRGTRYAAITWVQSYVRSAGMREILHDLNQAAHRVANRDAQSIEAKLLFKSYNNLLRSQVEN